MVGFRYGVDGLGFESWSGEILSVPVHIGPEADPPSCIKGVLDPFPGG